MNLNGTFDAKVKSKYYFAVKCKSNDTIKPNKNIIESTDAYVILAACFLTNSIKVKQFNFYIIFMI